MDGDAVIDRSPRSRTITAHELPRGTVTIRTIAAGKAAGSKGASKPQSTKAAPKAAPASKAPPKSATNGRPAANAKTAAAKPGSIKGAAAAASDEQARARAGMNRAGSVLRSQPAAEAPKSASSTKAAGKGASAKAVAEKAAEERIGTEKAPRSAGSVPPPKSAGAAAPITADKPAPKAGSVPPTQKSPVSTPPTEALREKPREAAPMSVRSEMQFKVGDKAVYPAQGVAEVVDIDEKDIAGNRQRFYVLRILDTDRKIMVPVNNASAVGLRQVISEQEIREIFDILRERTIAFDNQTWNRRYRGFMDKIKTGSIYDVAEVLRDLYRLKTDKQLSFGERRMLDTARSLIVKEIAIARDQTEEQVKNEIEAIFLAN
jgi:CarD family transcriptional regulator